MASILLMSMIGPRPRGEELKVELALLLRVKAEGDTDCKERTTNTRYSRKCNDAYGNNAYF